MADEIFPGPDWQDRPDPIASPYAVAGGKLTVYSAQYPKSLNYYLDSNVLSADVFSSLYSTLLTMHPITAEYEPGLARQWSISDDKRTFTFCIDPRARWSDGRPVTPEDVQWSFQAVMDPRNLTGPHKVSLEVFEQPEIVGTNAIRFTSREVHWRNLGAAGGFHILPRHAFAAMDFNKINFEFPVVCGPYGLGKVSEGVYVRLERRADWWAADEKRFLNTANFQTIEHRFFAESENAFEAFKKGSIDVFPVYMARLWVNETGGDKFDKHWIVKQKVRNYNPIGFQGFAMNMRRPPFDDLHVRMALAHLLNRERMNRTIMYGQYFMHRSYFEDLYSEQTPCANPVFDFNPDKARALLAKAGWTVNPDTGLVEKDGRRLTIKFLTRDPSADKFLAIYAEDLKSAGIELTIDRKDWAAWSKDMDEFNYDMTWAAWSAGVFKDPEGMWASREADRTGSHNITGFKNRSVDALIDQQKTIFDVQRRHDICRKIDAIITRECPYILLWNINYVRLLYWNKFGMPQTVLSKYGDERSAYQYWWYDDDSAADLEHTMTSGQPLPRHPDEVVFDQGFGQ